MIPIIWLNFAPGTHSAKDRVYILRTSAASLFWWSSSYVRPTSMLKFVTRTALRDRSGEDFQPLILHQTRWFVDQDTPSEPQIYNCLGSGKTGVSALFQGNKISQTGRRKAKPSRHCDPRRKRSPPYLMNAQAKGTEESLHASSCSSSTSSAQLWCCRTTDSEEYGAICS